MISKPEEIENEAFIDAVNDGDVLRDETLGGVTAASETAALSDNPLARDSIEERLNEESNN